MIRDELREKRWSPERAEKYMKELGVLRGINYVPAYATGYVTHWHDYREADIRRELLYAKRIGLNAVRIFMLAAQWQTRQEQVLGNIDRFLDLCAEMKISVMLSLQPNRIMRKGYQVTRENPVIENFRVNLHNGNWTYEGETEDHQGWRQCEDDALAFVRGVVARYAQDERVDILDLYNEAAKDCMELLEGAFVQARDVNPRQPLTACWNAQDISDIVTFHCYEDPLRVERRDPCLRTFEEEIADAKREGRPTLCTECLARPFGNELQAFLPVFAHEHIGFYVWGLCEGAGNFRMPWGWPEGSPEPKRWFHSLLYPDGTPYDITEPDVIMKFGWKE